MFLCFSLSARAFHDELESCQYALVGKAKGLHQAAQEGMGCGAPPGRAAILAAMRAGSPHSYRDLL